MGLLLALFLYGTHQLWLGGADAALPCYLMSQSRTLAKH